MALVANTFLERNISGVEEGCFLCSGCVNMLASFYCQILQNRLTGRSIGVEAVCLSLYYYCRKFGMAVIDVAGGTCCSDGRK